MNETLKHKNQEILTSSYAKFVEELALVEGRSVSVTIPTATVLLSVEQENTMTKTAQDDGIMNAYHKMGYIGTFIAKSKPSKLRKVGKLFDAYQIIHLENTIPHKKKGQY